MSCTQNKTECIAKANPLPEPVDYYEAIFDVEDKQASAKYELGSRPNKLYKKIISDSLKSAKTNRVLTPVTELYSMIILSELCNGKTKEEILNALKMEAHETAHIGKLIRDAVITPKGYGSCMCEMNSSLWIDKCMYPQKENLTSIFDRTGFESYSTVMGDPATDNEIAKWLTDKTGGFMDAEITRIKSKNEDAFYLFSTIMLNGKWMNEFRREENIQDYFTIDSGNKMKQEYMCDIDYTFIGQGSCFTTYSKSLHGGYITTFVLPDREKTVKDVINSEDGLLALATGYTPKHTSYIVHVRIPKFRVSERIDMIDMMKGMGIKSAFCKDDADFSEIVGNPINAFLVKAEQNCCFEIDEEGVKGAGLIECGGASGCSLLESQKDYYFYLDRPFLFTVTQRLANPIFTGVIYSPAE
ncbi:serpin family protein [Butyrivibrio sp. AE3004]|uniref:serpin family protein n=1 Tax=Butyrivibrio sp. AE3004 TaxID=1506994 RepID=UPI000493E6E4|nr:serpin family protein [Butyrivibrio sp. AE3004]